MVTSALGSSVTAVLTAVPLAIRFSKLPPPTVTMLLVTVLPSINVCRVVAAVAVPLEEPTGIVMISPLASVKVTGLPATTLGRLTVWVIGGILRSRSRLPSA